MRKNKMKDIQIVFRPVSVMAFGRDREYVTGGDGYRDVFYIMCARSFNDDVDFVKVVGMHVDGVVIPMIVRPTELLVVMFFLQPESGG